jgi:threonine/homoserine/homoserine lactone efflux protein
MDPEEDTKRASWMIAYFSTLILTLANPSTILSFAAVFAGFGMKIATTTLSGVWVVLGMFVGSALWWFTLSSGVGMLQKRLGHGWLKRVNQIAGATLVGCGVYSLSQLV